MVLRAFAAHNKYRRSEAAKIGAKLLKSRFFQPDCYTSYQAASYWVRFQYPFWWNNLVAALDSISLIDPSRDEQMEEALDWFIDHQEEDGLWKATYVRGKGNVTMGESGNLSCAQKGELPGFIGARANPSLEAIAPSALSSSGDFVSGSS